MMILIKQIKISGFNFDTLKATAVNFLLTFLFFSAVSILFHPDNKLMAQTHTDTHLQFGDDKKLIEIEKSDLLQGTRTKAGGDIKRLVGNVRLSQGNTILYCDSAYFNTNANTVEAFGKVHIVDGDSVHIYANKLDFDGNKRTALLKRNVVMNDGKSELKAEELNYSLANKRAILTKNVYLTDHKTQVRAERLVYDVKPKFARLSKNVRLTDGNVNVRSDSLHYDVNTTQSDLFGRAQLVDKETEITSNRMRYNSTTREGSYQKGGKLKGRNSTLTSENAQYYGEKRLAVFTNNVDLTSPQYHLRTAQLDYYLETEKAEFNGPTVINTNDGNTIHTNKGVYDAQNDELTLLERGKVRQDGREIDADKFNYNKRTGIGIARGNAVLIDTAQNLTIKSQNIDFFDAKKEMIAYGKPLLMNVIDNDTLYITADTLKSISKPRQKANNNPEDSTKLIVTPAPPTLPDTIRTFYAYRNTRILKSDMQAVCDSLTYASSDSIFKMFGTPVLWSDSTQFTADTIYLHTKNNKITQVALLQNAFVANKVQQGIYNQIKGKFVDGYFTNGQIKTVHVRNNAESIYFMQDENKAFSGMNQSRSAAIRMDFSDKKLHAISFLTNPEVVLTPIEQIKPNQIRLKGFVWHQDKRPLTLNDLF